MISSHKRNVYSVMLAVSLFAFIVPDDACAGGYEWGGLGSRAQAMGGAFVGLADDWTAIYWNPAGLTQLNGIGAGFDFSSPHVEIKDGDSLSNLPVGQMDTRYQRDVFAQYTGRSRHVSIRRRSITTSTSRPEPAAIGNTSA